MILPGGATPITTGILQLFFIHLQKQFASRFAQLNRVSFALTALPDSSTSGGCK
jgi:hypothetical protein